MHQKEANTWSRQDCASRAEARAVALPANSRKSLLEDRSDLTIEIDVLRERLSREGVRLK